MGHVDPGHLSLGAPARRRARARPGTKRCSWRGGGARPLYELRTQRIVAASQRAQWRRQGAFVLLALGLGAGLRAGEITAATGADVRSQRGVTVLDVAGTMSRTVVVQGPYFVSGHVKIPIGGQ